MARSDARIPTSLWRDEDFLALSSEARYLYLVLLTQKEVNAAGVLPLLPTRWCKWTGLPSHGVERATDELRERGWLICDDGPQEAFISGYFRAEKIGQQPRRTVAALTDIRALESELVAAHASTELHEAVDSAAPAVPRGVRAEVLARDGGQCQSCGWKPGDPVPVNRAGVEIYRALEVDHVIPRSKGGPDAAANRQVLCTSCNASKGARV